MRVVIVGAGGVGGNLGARLAEAGHDVAWLARGRNLAALRAGLSLESPLGDLRLGPQLASDDAAALAPADAVVIGVKMYSLAEVASALSPLARGPTLLLPLQNGIEARGILAAALPGAQVLQGMVATKSHLAGPAHVVCKSGFARIRFGGDAPRGPMQTLADALNSGKGVTATLTKDIDADVWRKFVMLASFSAVACLARATIGQVLDDSAAYALLLAAVREAVAVARARGVAVPGDAEELVQSQVRDLPRDGRPSMLEDLEAGRPLELDYLSGAIVRLAEQAGIAVPVHATASRALAMHSGGRR